MIHPIRGSTASSALPGPRRTARDQAGSPAPHGVGNVLRAVGVYLDTAFRVVVLGSDGTPHRDRAENGNPGATGAMR